MEKQVMILCQKDDCYIHLFGSVFLIKDKFYILTLYNIVANHDVITVYINIGDDVLEYNVYIFVSSIEINLCLLSIDHPFTEYYTINDLHEKIIKNNLITEYLEMDDSTTDSVEYSKKISHSVSCNIEYTDFHSMNHVKLPLLCVIFNNQETFQDISGTIVLQNRKIIGILSNFFDNYIHVVPSILIMRFLKEFILINTFSGLCTIVCDYECEDIDIKNDNTHNYCLFVKDNYNIKYNKFKESNNKNGNTLKNNYYIVAINGKLLNDDYKIYEDTLDEYICPMLYIALNFQINQLIPLSVYDGNLIKQINIKARPLESIKYIPIKSNDVLNVRGLVLKEVDEECILSYYDIDAMLDGVFMDNYFENKYSSNPFRWVYIDSFDISDKQGYLNEYTKANLLNHMIDTNTYTLPIVNKVNGKKVKGLANLKNIKIDSMDIRIHDKQLKLVYNGDSLSVIRNNIVL